ncbi:MAG: hypothetical protein V4725_03970 [Bacteroidota bacterium]
MKKKYAIRNLITGLLMTAISLWIATTDLVFGGIATVFFGSITLLILTRQFKSGRMGNGNAGRRSNADNLLDANEDGIFKYDEKGFSLMIQRNQHSIPWKEIRTMVAYKMDRFASDDISMDVFCERGINFSISEETAGWLKFLDNSKNALPIDKFWEIEMATPGLEINLSVIYDRQNRAFKEIQKEYYNN